MVCSRPCLSWNFLTMWVKENTINHTCLKICCVLKLPTNTNISVKQWATTREFLSIFVSFLYPKHGKDWIILSHYLFTVLYMPSGNQARNILLSVVYYNFIRLQKRVLDLMVWKAQIVPHQFFFIFSSLKTRLLLKQQYKKKTESVGSGTTGGCNDDVMIS